jgi:hypothetical protein
MGGEAVIKWIARLEIADLWKAKEKDEITLAALCKGIVERFEALRVKPPDHLLEPLRELAEDEEGDDIEAFDDAWRHIYSWADLSRVWIATF